jgi:hypothetical protein
MILAKSIGDRRPPSDEAPPKGQRPFVEVALERFMVVISRIYSLRRVF